MMDLSSTIASLQGLPFSPATMVAPMEGVTNALMRELLARCGGVGMVCTEFVRITSTPIRAKTLAATVQKLSNVPLSVQVMGRDVNAMAHAAHVLSHAGADVIDINLGCPTSHAVKGGVGAAMLRDTQVLAQVVTALRRATPGVLSAKMRAGFNTWEHALHHAQVLVNCGVDFLVVHPRRRVDGWNTGADWRIVKLLASELSIPVVGNGDIWYATDALRLQQESGCAGVMLGRPALRNPWIFSQIQALRDGTTPYAPTGADLVSFLKDYVERMRADPMPEKAIIGRAKEFVTYMRRALPDGTDFGKQTLRLATTDEVLRACEKLASRSSDAIDLHADGHLQLERRARVASDLVQAA